MSIKKETSFLAKMKSSWKKAQTRERLDFEDLEAGVYIMAICGATLAQWGDKKKTAIKFDYVVQEGECAGSTQTVFENCETEDNMFFIQLLIEKLGYELPEIEELEEVLKDIENTKPIVRARVTNREGFTNIRVLKLIEGEGGLTKEELLGTDGAEVSKKKKSTPAPTPTENADEATEVVKRSASNIVLEVGTKVSFEESEQVYTGVIAEEPQEDGTVDVEVDEVEEVWNVSIKENNIQLLEEKSAKQKASSKKKAPAKKKVEEPVIEEEDAISVGTEVAFESGDDTLYGVVVEIDDTNADVDVEDDGIYTVPIEDLMLVEE